MKPRINGWCARGSHRACPDTPWGGLAGLAAKARRAGLASPCECWCHTPDTATQPSLLTSPSGPQ